MIYVLARSPSADFVLLIASLSCPGITNGKGRCARDLSGYKAVSGQPFCSAIAIPAESISRRFLVWKRQALDGAPCKWNLERIATLQAERPEGRQKLAFYREGYDCHTEAQQTLKVTVIRLASP